ncbi:unnamed protein product [Ceutorhynchus assimilis]|uniref:Enoyl-CoA hydratase domain-containing protein 3, mitochondrial n=1 Tax=Ceutorhynchus assimilis TaxID=467358 RepID=A0A9N9MZE4_9CUCU|nr:unnamed protein product [Ceutorhynchus assimilis]
MLKTMQYRCKTLLFNPPIKKAVERFMSDYQFIKTDFANEVKNIVMCDPKTRNALSASMMEGLLNAIVEVKENPEIRVVVISGEGPAFSGGHNLKEIADNVEIQNKVFQTASNLMMSIIDCPVPVIAKIDGMAIAAGCQLVAQCDIAIASDKSTFSTPGANFGIFCSTPGIALSRCVSKMPSLYMLLTGLPVKAQEAKEIGLITKVCPSEKLDEEVDFVCNAIKAKSRDVVELGKRFYNEQICHDVKTAYKLGADKMVENLQMGDCKEGIRSFIEKRKPNWGMGCDTKQINK